jgi:hypothetical protein
MEDIYLNEDRTKMSLEEVEELAYRDAIADNPNDSDYYRELCGDLNPNYDFWEDEDFVYDVVERNPSCILSACKKLKQDYNLWVFALENGLDAELVPDEFFSNYDVVLWAVRYDGGYLEKATKELQDNFRIVYNAVKQDGMALQYASYSLRGNVAIVMEAIKNCPSALQFATMTLKNNVAIVTSAVSGYGMALQYASMRVKDNFAVCLTALLNNRNALQFCSKRVVESFKELESLTIN